MKYLNKVLCIVAFFSVGLISARPMGGAAAPAQPTPARVTPPTPAGRPAITPGKPAAQAANYKATKAQILGMGEKNVIQNNLLRPDFIKKMKDIATDKIELELFLKIARDKYLPLTGNDNTDLARLQAINQQIAQA